MARLSVEGNFQGALAVVGQSQQQAKPADFKHRVTRDPLWMEMDSRYNTSWVKDDFLKHAFTEEQSTADTLSPAVIWACMKKKDLSRGIRLHDEILQRGLHEENFSDALITMYAKCGQLPKAQALLDMHSSRSIIPWTALIASYAQERQGQSALDCFERLKRQGIPPDAVTYVSVLKACAVMGAVDKGTQIHNEILQQGLLEHEIVLGGALVDMYAKCGALSQAQSVLEMLPSRNVVSWSALIASYAREGLGKNALNCFEQMQREGIPPDAVTYISVLKACGMMGALDKGKQIHNEIRRQGLLEHEIVLGGALVDMYAKCGALPQAQSVLENLPSRNVVCWSALIAGYVQKGQGQRALECVEQMQHEGISPNAVTYVCILKACAMAGAIDKGREIHDEILRQGMLEHSIVLGGALVDMYAKCGAFTQAQSVLENLPSRNVISWSSLIRGYAQKGQGQQALKCFDQMQHEGISPNALTYVSVLNACAVSGAIDRGKKIHEEIARQGLLEQNVVLGSALVDMYAKCGDLLQAQSALEKLPFRNVISWNSLIAGYAQEGQVEQALRCFKEMQHEGILPDIVTFLCLLNLCCHLGLVEKGQELFDDMGVKYGLAPDIECFTCMVDLLGRAGHLVKAVKIIQEMPFSPSSAIWHCLLGACWKWADVNLGTWAFQQAVELDRHDEAAYILMVNIYKAAGMPNKAKNIQDLRAKNEAWSQSV